MKNKCFSFDFRITDNIFEMLFETAKQFHFETIKNLSMPFRRLVNESISIKSEMNDLNTFINLKENDIEHSKFVQRNFQYSKIVI